MLLLLLTFLLLIAVAEELATALNAHLNGGESNAQGGRDFLIRVVVHVAHDEWDAESVGHGAEDAGNALLFGGQMNELFGGGWDGNIREGWIVVHRQESFAALLADVIKAMVDFDALQPVADRGLTLKSTKAEIGFYEYFLREVFRVDGVAGKIAAVSEDAAMVLRDQLFEGTEVAVGGGKSGLMQLLVERRRVVRVTIQGFFRGQTNYDLITGFNRRREIGGDSS